LLEAYSLGIFPWYEEGETILWWSPDPRAILELPSFHVSKSLARTVRSGRFRVTFDEDFEGVIAGCAESNRGGTWITREMTSAYIELHHLGHAHSVEAWCDDRLAGGLYGVTLGGLFAGESMFFRERDASKVATVALVGRLRERGFTLLDLQMLTEHTARFGGIEVPRAQYLERVRQAVRLPVRFD
jgi:leucyl/phenylalanyl-tRNA--protein transferase